MKTFRLQTLLQFALVACFCSSAFAQTGFLDIANATLVSGWACIPGQPFRSLSIQILVDNTIVGTTAASLNRPDVASSCGGVGTHGFTFNFPANVQATLQNGQTHSVRVLTVQTFDGVPRFELNGSPKTVAFTNSLPIGFLDAASSTVASGWACDANDFNSALRVDIYIDNVFAGSTTANLPREISVAQQCGGNANHGWSFTFPANFQSLLADGNVHTVQAYGINTPNGNNPQLSGSPKTVQTTRVPPTPTPGPNAAPIGFLDIANATFASGWACDADNFNSLLRVDIYIDNNVFAGSTTANLPREAGVAQQCGGNANHGWSFFFPANIRSILSNGNVHTVQAYAINTPTGNNPQLSGSPKTVQTTRVDPTPTPGPNSSPIGYFDAGSATVASGWTCDPDNFNSALRVDIYIDNNFVGSTTANLPREAGVAQQCGGNAYHGWSYTFPANIQALLSDGQSHTIRAYAINTPTGNNPELNGSPKTVQIALPNQAPKGFLDAASRTSASGWACDPDNFNTPLRVDIYINNNIFAGSTTANIPREAGVAQQCGGNANHGWSFNFPANIQALLANGGTVNAYAINTPNGNNPQLSGSPRNV